MPMKDYLEDVFDEKVIIEIYEGYQELPLFLTNEYEFFKCEIHEIDCTLLKLKSERILIDKIQKHFLKLKEYGLNRLVLVLDDLRTYQRRKLISARVPFVVPNRQIYLPFICLDLNEKVSSCHVEVVKFTATTQLAFLHLLHSKRREVKTKTLSSELGIAYASANRAIRQLISVGLIIESGVSTRKHYERLEKKALWEKGKMFLTNPVQQTLFMKELPLNIAVFFSEDSALAEKSMLANPRISVYAMSKKNVKLIEKRIILNEHDSDNAECYKIEVWKYDPAIFAEGNHVDIFSLYALYLEQEDPRIEIELEGLLEEALCVD